jgi:hypothetical protein
LWANQGTLWEDTKIIGGAVRPFQAVTDKAVHIARRSEGIGRSRISPGGHDAEIVHGRSVLGFPSSNDGQQRLGA